MDSSDASVVLAANGFLRSRIAGRWGASPTEEFAADELRRYLGRMTGDSGRPRPHSATIYINDADAASAAGIDVPALKLSAESFHIETRGGNVYILGGGERGVLYGVYELLERLGCRWYTADVTHVPRTRKIMLPPTGITQSPAFEFRDTTIWEAREPTWSVANPMNGHFTAAPSYMGGHTSYGLFVHTSGHLLPPEEYFDEHPEYFSLVDGVRRRDKTQLCLTNPDVLRLVTERVLSAMGQYRAARIFSVSQNDWGNWCTCPACSALAEEEGSQSGPILRFANAVAERTAKVFPRNLIDTIAYSYSLQAPRKARPHANVRVRLCPIGCCQAHAFGTCDHAGSRKALAALQDWSAITRQLYIWHYCTNFANYQIPMPDLDELHDNIGLYHRSGAYGLFMQGAGEAGGGELGELRAWIIARLLWNPNQDVWKLVDEFLPAVYGVAAPHVRQYLDLFHGRVRGDKSIHPSLYDPPSHALFAGGIVERAEKILAEGEHIVWGPAKSRMRNLHAGVSYVRLYRDCGTFHREDDEYFGDVSVSRHARAHQMVRDWGRAGVTALQENATWRFSTQRLINRLRPHMLLFLRDGEQEIAIVPGLGGRLLEWHALGRQWLSQPTEAGPWWQTYPFQEGYQESAYLSHFGHVGWVETYRATQKGNSIKLSADLGDGMFMSRTFALKEGTLSIKSRLENRSAEGRSLGWGAAVRLLVPNTSRLQWRDGAGEVQLGWSDLPEGYDRPMLLEGTRLPAGEWEVDADGLRIRATFASDRPLALSLARVEGEGKLVIDLRTPSIYLQHKQSLEIEQAWSIARGR